MSTLQTAPSANLPARSEDKSQECRDTPAPQVRKMLLELAYALHTTRVVGYRGPIAPKKG